MDHLMPGMDGFQAVQAIKNNPRTATIPIMMYTSQEGELYLSQARALGAIGVLPKQIKHADVSKALEQLQLLGEPRAARARPRPLPRRTTLRAPTVPLPLDTAPPLDITMRAARAAIARSCRRCRRSCARSSRRMLAHHMRELRRFMVENLETQCRSHRR